METGTESNSSLVRVDLDITKNLVIVGSDDDVDGLDCSREGLVQIFLGNLQLKKGTVDLVDDTDGLDTLSKGLSEDGLGLDADTRDTVDDDESTVGDTEGSSDLRREINVTGGIDQVDQELISLAMVGDLLEIVLILQLGIEGDGG